MEKVKDALSCYGCKESINIIKTTSEKIHRIERYYKHQKKCSTSNRAIL